MHDRGKSDDPVVPAKLPNNAQGGAAEVVEGSGSAKGNAASETRSGPSGGPSALSDLDRVRRVARKDKDARFTPLLDHVDVDRLRAAYWAIRPKAAPGVDGVTWTEYGQDLEVNLRDLHARVHRGSYRARPSRRVFIPKPDGRLRPHSRQEAERALAALSAILAELGLELKQAKTRIVHLEEGGEGLDFLGFHHRWVRGNTPRSRHLCFLARWPSRQAMHHARDRTRELADRHRLLVPVDDVVQDVNRFLRGWAGYFRYGNSARQFNDINLYALNRLARFVTKRHKPSWRYGWKAVAYQSPDRLGLITFNGTIVAPRPNRPWRPGR